jgi:proteic killer suppression protein
MKHVIVSFKHKGLKRLYERGDRSGIRPDLLENLEEILSLVDAAATPQALNLPGYRLHQQRRPQGVLGYDGARELAVRVPL